MMQEAGRPTGTATDLLAPRLDPPGQAVAAALTLRDQALCRLDGGDPAAAMESIRAGMDVLEGAGVAGGLDRAALLVAQAEIEECLDRFLEARRSIETAIALLECCPACERDDEDTVLLWCQAQERLAGLDRLAGRFEAASARLGVVLERAAATWGETSRAVVSAANALGVVYKYAAEFDAAQAAYQRALRALDAAADPDPLVRAGLLHNLGGLAHSRGDFEAGVPLAEQGLALRLDVLGEGHPDVARDLNALGSLYQLAGRLTDAEAACGRALSIFEDRLGSDHFEVAMACANLAALAGDQARYVEAERLGRRALCIFENVLGPADAEVGLTLLNLAVAVARQDRRGEAVRLAERAARSLADQLPPHHPYVVAARDMLSWLGTS
jgi:tetratricopeptide (TPR) repeat protein